jgi:hypothetical protein
VLLFHGYERDDVESVVGQSKAIADGNFACGLAGFDDVRINEFHRNVVLDEPKSSGLSYLGFCAACKTIDETIEILGVCSIHGVAQAISDFGLGGVAWFHSKPRAIGCRRGGGGRVGFRGGCRGPRHENRECRSCKSGSSLMADKWHQ